MKTSPLNLTAWICAGLIVLAVASSMYIASTRSTGIKSITVTFVGKEEIRDHKIPLFKKKESLPDYTLSVKHAKRGRILLGTKVDQSAREGLSWELPKTYSTEDITLISLTDKDELLSDSVAEVSFTGKQVVENEYQFEYELETSFKIGLESFWETAVGKAIMWAVSVTALIILLCIFAPLINAIAP